MKYFRYYLNLVENERSVTSYSFLNKIVKIFFFLKDHKNLHSHLLLLKLWAFLQSYAPSNGTAVGKDHIW